ncbi:MAG: MATE family efflux transporter [Erysipelotrichaceae bacterium]|nr:MATE family efflux transporter [Erysipelotrichaceae bacterium]
MPIVLTTLLQQFYSMVDLMVAGQFVGSIGTVGVSIGGELADLLAPVAMSFATAGQIYIAQLFGAKDLKRTKETIGTLLTVMMGFSIFGMLLIFVLREPLLHWLNCPPEAWNQAMSYLIITTFGLPFVFGYNAVVGILRGMGESKRPLYFIMVATVVNIVADIILVAVFRLEAAGTALATIASQFGSFAAAFYYMYKHREHFDFELKLSYFKMHSHHLKVIVKLAIPQIVRSSFVRFSMLWVNSHINAYGLVVSATNSVGNKISKFLEAFVAGIDTAAGAMIGQNLGARQHQRAGRIVWVTLACCLSIATVCSALGLFFPKQIFSMFTTDTAVLAMSVVYLQIYVMSFYMSAITGTFQAMVTGCGFVSLGFLIGILDAVVCRIGFSLLFSEVFHLEHLSYWLGTGFSRTLPGLLCFLYFMSGKWKTRKLLSEQK